MKCIGAVMACLLICQLSSAQLQLGLAGGAHQSDVLESSNYAGTDSLQQFYSPRRAMHFGFIANVPFSSRSIFNLQTGAMYYQKGRTFSASYDSTGMIASEKFTYYTNYIDVPLHLVLKFRLGKKTRLMMGGGPYLSYFFDGIEKSETHYTSGSSYTDENRDLEVGADEGQYRNFHYGASALFGFEIGRVFLRADYSRGLTDFYKSPHHNGSFQHETMGGTVGVMLGKSPQPTPKQSKDSDNDGVIDRKDECPDVAGSTLLKGCPDQDGDGIPDKDDACVSQAGSAANKGCPSPDMDGDGVPNTVDKCPDVAGSAKYLGCPVPDTDYDGVNDDEDKCPTIKGTAKYEGCPVPDTDMDGLNDEEDKCPEKIGPKENQGCPTIKTEIVQKVNTAASRIQFRYRSDELSISTYNTLESVIRIMKENPDLKLLIEGHTSNDGIVAENIKLSKKRAENVKQYLESRGISATRMTTIGYGPSRPLNKGKSEALKALNRRVELKLEY